MKRMLVLVPLLGACASSPLIRPDDAEFRAAQERLAQTDARARAEAGSPAEAALFLQAESFFRYRWSLHLHDSHAYALQLLAASIDFGPLSTLAAGNGVSDLRLQAYDGAAQLFEAHLARFPEGKLAQVSLWRLGWAYRAAQADAFPRGSDEAFSDLARRGDPVLGQLAKEAQRAPWKSQDKAVTLSILPGLGQIYAGETLNGVVRMAIAVGFSAMLATPLVMAARGHALGWQGVAVSTAGLIGLQVSYTTAYQDAQRAALEFDEREEAAFFAAHPAAP